VTHSADDHTVPAKADVHEEIVLGVDTHADMHVAAVITVMGVLLGTQAFPATAAGYAALLDWARGHGRLRRAGIEGTSSHGTALNRYLRRHDLQILEVNRPDRARRRRRGKTDAVDAENAARAVLSQQATAIAKTGDGAVEMIRMLKVARDSAIKARTQAINQLRAVLMRADPTLRDTMAALGPATLIRTCADLPTTDHHTIDDTARTVLRMLARRILALTEEARAHERTLVAIITARAPKLLQQYGIGPDTAAALLITAGDNSDRLGSEAAFAALCGVNPIEASSGKTVRHRLNRGGDRRSNSALYTIVVTRLGRDTRTRAYAERRTAEGKSKKEIIRCLKRYVAREVFPIINEAHSHLRISRPLRLDKHRGVIALHLQLGALLGPLSSLPAQPGEFLPLGLGQLTTVGVLLASQPIHLHPVGQRARIDAQILRDLRDWLFCLPHDAHRARPELRIEPASGLSHDPTFSLGQVSTLEGEAHQVVGHGRQGDVVGHYQRPGREPWFQ
jgi:transposase